MRREHDRRALPAELEHDVAQGARVHRVETGERLVKDQKLRLGDDRAQELNLLGHPFRELVDALVGPVLELQPIEPAVDDRIDLRQ
jgi:hypothetical protein